VKFIAFSAAASMLRRLFGYEESNGYLSRLLWENPIFTIEIYEIFKKNTQNYHIYWLNL
jgi:hypothetical protein